VVDLDREKRYTTCAKLDVEEEGRDHGWSSARMERGVAMWCTAGRKKRDASPDGANSPSSDLPWRLAAL
jgi:hypothetical protein